MVGRQKRFVCETVTPAPGSSRIWSQLQVREPGAANLELAGSSSTDTDIISDKICSKTNKNNQGQVTNLSEQVIAMVLVTNLHQNSKWMHTAHEDTKINIYEDEDMNIHNNTAAV